MAVATAIASYFLNWYRTTASAHEVGAHVMGIGGNVGTEDESARLDRALARGADGAWIDDPMCER